MWCAVKEWHLGTHWGGWWCRGGLRWWHRCPGRRPWCAAGQCSLRWCHTGTLWPAGRRCWTWAGCPSLWLWWGSRRCHFQGSQSWGSPEHSHLSNEGQEEWVTDPRWLLVRANPCEEVGQDIHSHSLFQNKTVSSIFNVEVFQRGALRDSLYTVCHSAITLSIITNAQQNSYLEVDQNV